MTPYLSIIIPCYNEEKNLQRGVLDEVYSYLTKQKFSWELIVVNDQSTDNSEALIKEFLKGKKHAYLTNIAHGGKPVAIWTGIKQARGEVVLFTDMDQSTPITELAKLLPWYKQGFDVVIGSRGIKREGFSLLRKTGSIVFKSLRGFFLHSLADINDTQCGFKSCTREVAQKIFPKLQFFRSKERPSGWKVSAYDVELLYLIKKAGFRVKEVVVKWSNEDISDTKSQSSDLGRYIKESKDMAKEVLRVKRNELKGLYTA